LVVYIKIIKIFYIRDRIKEQHFSLSSIDRKQQIGQTAYYLILQRTKFTIFDIIRNVKMYITTTKSFK
jgi:hypothetical protein